MEILIRPQKDSDDYQAICDLWNSRYPEDQYSVTEGQHYDEDSRKPPCKFERLLAFVDDKLVGAATARQFSGQYHPQKFNINIHVDEAFEKQGIATMLYQELIVCLREEDVISVRTNVREDLGHAVRLAEQEGFETTKKDFLSVINPQKHDFSVYHETISNLEAQGITIKSLKDIGLDEANCKKAWKCYSEVRMDVPRSESATQMSYESFRTHFLDGPDCLPEALFVACADREFIGVTNFWKSETTKDLYTGLTGVKQDYRGRRVATVLKARAMLFAQTYGSEAVYTENDTNNIEMLKVNENFGFEKKLVWLSMVKKFVTQDK